MITLQIATYTDPTGNYTNARTLVQKMFDAISSKLNSLFQTSDATIDVDVEIDPTMTSTAGANEAYPGFVPGSQRVTLASVAATKALSGIDNNGSASDATIYLSPIYMSFLSAWEQGAPGAAGIDEVTLHEMLHVLGMAGFRNNTTGDLPIQYQSLFDSFVSIQGNRPFFTGSNAAAILGEYVPLIRLTNPSSIYHIDSGALSALNGALMAPTITVGTHELDVELAMFKDLGFSVIKTLTSLDGHTFIPGLNATVTGSAAIDRAIYSGNKANYTISSGENGITVAAKTGAADADTLTNIERVQFGDVTMAFDANGNAGQVYRLYQAAFNRAPDHIGLGFWIKSMDQGGTLQNVAHNFITSSEFTALYGTNLSNADFLSHVYANILHRMPDQDGYNWWLNALNSGASREGILIGFSESLENRAQIILDTNSHEAQVYRLYQAAFDRTPDTSGLVFWINALNNGMSLASVASSFLQSEEFKSTYGTSLNNTQYLTLLYEHALHRVPDQDGFNWWLDSLNSGAPREGALVGFSEGDENRMQLELMGVIKDGIEYLPYA